MLGTVLGDKFCMNHDDYVFVERRERATYWLLEAAAAMERKYLQAAVSRDGHLRHVVLHAQLRLSLRAHFQQ